MPPKRPLAQLLGIKAGDTILLADEPAGFRARLNPLPHDIAFATAQREAVDVACIFVVAESELVRQLPAMAARLAPQCRLWVFWPRRHGAILTDLSDEMVRATGAASRLVDHGTLPKEPEWSVLLFRRADDTETRPLNRP
ncbi:MAG: hypothetical protein ABIF71_04635 [Planctomycetota bacterium]